MDALFRIDNWLCLQIRKCSLGKISCFSERSVIYRFFLRDSKKFSPSKYDFDEKESEPGRIWVFWAQGYDSMPEVVRRCYKSIMENRGDFEVVLLDMNNFTQYVDIPDYILQKVENGAISLTHFSDILRFSLLRTWGGYWMDATIFVSKRVLNPNRLFTIKHQWNNLYVSGAQWCGFLWYMPKDHPLARFMVDYLYDYWRSYNQVIEYLLMDYLIRIFYEKNQDFRKEIDDLSMSNPDLYFFQSSASELCYDEKRWQEIMKQTQFFKTTWKSSKPKMKDGTLTFYGHFLQSK